MRWGGCRGGVLGEPPPPRQYATLTTPCTLITTTTARAGYPTCTAFLVGTLAAVGAQYGIGPGGSLPSTIPLWGSGIHQATFEHQLLAGTPLQCLANRATFHGGDDTTVNVGHMDLTDDALPQGAGPSFRHVANLASLDASAFVHPMGQDGATLSTNYDSLLPLWTTGRYLSMASTQLSAVTPLITEEQTLTP